MDQNPIRSTDINVAAADHELYRRLQLSLILRVAMVTFLLAATFSIQFSKHPSLEDRALIPLYLLSGITYFFTIISALSLRWIQRLRPFAFIQIVWEILFVTALIYDTSGPFESIFSFLYLIAIIMAGILQYRAGAFFAAALGSLFYGVLMTGLESGVLPHWPSYTYFPVGWYRLIYTICINMAAMFGMAVLSSYLTEKLRTTGRELQQTQRHRDVLEALNDIVVRSIPSGLITLDREGQITSLNLAAARIAGVPAGEVPAQSFRRVFPSADEFMPPYPGGVPTRTSRHETAWKTPSGETRNLEFTISPMRKTGGETLGALIVVNDITEIRRMEKKLRHSDRMAAVGQLAAGIAHEIRNPLASMSGAIQMLEADLELDPPSQRLMKIVLRETERLNGLITDFLLYARPEAKSIQTVTLERLIPEMIEVLKHRADITPEVEWGFELGPGLTLDTDPKLLEQILWNLLNNAVESLAGKGKVVIRASETIEPVLPDAAADGEGPGGRAMVMLEVEDNGPGIPPEMRDRIFDPFFTTREGGTGLGLSTAYRIVEAMEGSIVVEDGGQGGARFVIKVPKRQTVAAPEGSKEKESGTGTGG